MSNIEQIAADTTAWINAGQALRIVLAVVLGGIIGLERELGDKPAGLRTIILICVGACMFTIVSQIVGGPDWDSTRIAAQIVSGIGFLGAGAIIRDRQSVIGMTTAATIWAVAAIGMACGFGLWMLAIHGTVVILVALLVFEEIEKRIGARLDIQNYHIAAANSVETLHRVDSLFENSKLRVRKRFYHEDGDSLVVHIVAMGSKSEHEKLRCEVVQSEVLTLRRG